jgi:hypothetical protein
VTFYAGTKQIAGAIFKGKKNNISIRNIKEWLLYFIFYVCEKFHVENYLTCFRSVNPWVTYKKFSTCILIHTEGEFYENRT